MPVDRDSLGKIVKMALAEAMRRSRNPDAKVGAVNKKRSEDWVDCLANDQVVRTSVALSR